MDGRARGRLRLGTRRPPFRPGVITLTLNLLMSGSVASHRRRPSPKANEVARDQAQKGLDADFMSRTAKGPAKQGVCTNGD